MLITLLILIPIIAAVGVWLLPARLEALAPRISLATAFVTLVIAAILWFGIDPSGAALVDEFDKTWIKTSGVSIH